MMPGKLLHNCAVFKTQNVIPPLKDSQFMDYDNSQDIGEYNPKKTSSTRGFEDCHTAQ